MVVLKRAYELAAKSDGTRVLVDRLWPRGITKEKAHLDAWLKDLAPSNELRRWYHARPSQWLNFRKKYLAELAEPAAAAALDELYRLAERRARLTLVYGSQNTDHNNATVLKQLLDGMRKPPASSGPARAATARRARAARRP